MTEKTLHDTRLYDNRLASKKPDHEIRTNFNRGEYGDLASKKRHIISGWFGPRRFNMCKNNVASTSLHIQYNGKTVLKKRRLYRSTEPHEITGMVAKLAGWNDT